MMGEEGRRYHHGDLRSALLRTSAELLAENGPADFSVARVARRLGVSTAAPYRHFRDRDTLLAAVATQAAADLATAVRDAADAAGPDPVDRLASAAGAYVRHMTERGVGFDLIYGRELRTRRDAALTEAGRELMDLLLGLARAARPAGPVEDLALLEQVVTLAHGFATLDREGFLSRARHETTAVADRATRAAAALVRGGA
ncbi:MAG: TetR/AcrR family transcriptional regulator [Pseudonocardia sediminis]